MEEGRSVNDGMQKEMIGTLNV